MPNILGIAILNKSLSGLRVCRLVGVLILMEGNSLNSVGSSAASLSAFLLPTPLSLHASLPSGFVQYSGEIVLLCPSSHRTTDTSVVMTRRQSAWKECHEKDGGYALMILAKTGQEVLLLVILINF